MNRLLRALLAAASCFSLALWPYAGAIANAALPTLPPASASFDSGMLHVDRYGNGAKSIVFIPGLGCGAWSWAEQIRHFSSSYTVYAVTLSGFDGRAFTPQSDLFAAFDRDFWTFAQSQHLDKPVVIGHSLGGTLGFVLAESHPERLAGVIALDGLPVFPMLAQSTPAQRDAAATNLASSLAHQTHDELVAYEVSYMKQIGTVNDDLDAPVASLVAKSDPNAIAAWGAADLRSDLRAGLAKADVRMLELMPYAQPSPYSKEQTLGFYRMLVAGAPHADVVAIDGARHFAMLDQPQAVDDAITRFLAAAP